VILLKFDRWKGVYYHVLQFLQEGGGEFVATQLPLHHYVNSFKHCFLRVTIEHNMADWNKIAQRVTSGSFSCYANDVSSVSGLVLDRKRK